MKCRLREILEANGIKQSWLADKVGVHRSHINKLMNEDANPTLLLAFKIAAALRLTVYDIWELEDN